MLKFSKEFRPGGKEPYIFVSKREDVRPKFKHTKLNLTSFIRLRSAAKCTLAFTLYLQLCSWIVVQENKIRPPGEELRNILSKREDVRLKFKPTRLTNIAK